MQSKLDMVVFGEDWHGHPSSTQHLIKHLSKNRKILWFNSIGLRRPKINLYDLKRCLSKVTGYLQKNTSKETNSKKTGIVKNINIINGLTIPVPLNVIERFINKNSLKKTAKAGLDKSKINKSVLWMSLPTAIDAMGACNEELSVYYCCDDFSSLAGVDHKPVTKIEKELIEKVDVIFTSNENLSYKLPSNKTHYIPHGVDYDLFSSPTTRAVDMPEGNKIAGFYGAIHEWLNVDLLIEAATSLPNWKFVFVGPVHRDVTELEKLLNVYFLGEKSHHELPSYVQHWDIAMLPFNDCNQIKHCNPLKLREYMASGTAVLSTDFPAARHYEQEISIASSNDQFIAFFDKIEGLETKMKQAHAQQKMQNESWEARAQDIECIISNYLK